MEFPRQEYWSGLPFHSLGDLPGPGIEHTSPALTGRFFTTEPPGKPSLCVHVYMCSTLSVLPRLFCSVLYIKFYFYNSENKDFLCLKNSCVLNNFMQIFFSIQV